MIDQPRQEQPKAQGRKKVAVACQGGGIHTSFAVGVLTEILRDIQQNNRFDLMGLSGTSGGALCTLMVWYGLAQKNGRPGSEQEAIDQLNEFWDRFAATRVPEKLLNQFSYAAFRAQEMEVLGLSASVLGLNPRSTISKAVTAGLPFLGVRRRYFDLHRLLDKSCPLFDRINWNQLETRLLVGASDVISGIETIFDSDCNIREVSTLRQLELRSAGASGFRYRCLGSRPLERCQSFAKPRRSIIGTIGTACTRRIRPYASFLLASTCSTGPTRFGLCVSIRSNARSKCSPMPRSWTAKTN